MKDNLCRNGLACCVAVLGFLSEGWAGVEPTEWPQWRGPTRDGQVRGFAWPTSVQSSQFAEKWRVELGPSYSGPLVVGNLVFTTETRDKELEVVRAFDRATGQPRWEVTWAGSMSVPFFAKSNGDWIRSTPAYAEGTLYVAGMRDVLVALEAATGRERWRVDFVEMLQTPLPAFGFVCSPLVDGEGLYVQAGASVVRLDPATGRLVWRALEDEGGMWGSAFSSPVIANLGGTRQLVVQTRTTLAGSTATGGCCGGWKFRAFRGMNILTPVVFDDLVMTSSYGGKTLGHRVKCVDGRWQVELAWSLKQQGYMSTPVVVDGHAYLHLRNQRVACLDLREGRERWTSGEAYGKYWSLVTQGDRILALDQRGVLYLLRANPSELEVVDSRALGVSDTWAHLAISGQDLFVRGLNELVAYRWTQPRDPASD
ncbi:MAG: PQQ-like beta-propeller repeat protein [Verrucomicrobiales bacterium]|nr:PQQ-like beta-propeller repeat protein [Verrucomicrobiales bacterium]